MSAAAPALDAVRAFLAELAALGEKHAIKISGCGCCGSPWLLALPPDQRGGFYVVDPDMEKLTYVCNREASEAAT